MFFRLLGELASPLRHKMRRPLELEIT
jgi:hypothetical protein